MEVHVETRPNALGDPEPCRFRVGGGTLDVTEVLDRWLDRECGYFKVGATDGAVYILRRDAESGGWDVTHYDSGRRPPTPASPGVKRRQ